MLFESMVCDLLPNEIKILATNQWFSRGAVTRRWAAETDVALSNEFGIFLLIYNMAVEIR